MRLRVAMYEAWGQDASDLQWQQRCREVLLERLGADDFAAYVVEDGGEVVSGGVGWIEFHLPGPLSPDGRRGHIASMSTLPPAQRRGHGRRVVEALLAWMTEQGLSRVDLRATTFGEPLYSRMGFQIATGLPMTWTPE